MSTFRTDGYEDLSIELSSFVKSLVLGGLLYKPRSSLRQLGFKRDPHLLRVFLIEDGSEYLFTFGHQHAELYYVDGDKVSIVLNIDKVYSMAKALHVANDFLHNVSAKSFTIIRRLRKDGKDLFVKTLDSYKAPRNRGDSTTTRIHLMNIPD